MCIACTSNLASETEIDPHGATDLIDPICSGRNFLRTPIGESDLGEFGFVDARPVELVGIQVVRTPYDLENIILAVWVGLLIQVDGAR